MNDISLRNYFLKAFSTRREKPAITFFRDGVVETELTYGELDRDSNRMANALSGLGVILLGVILLGGLLFYFLRR